MKRCGRGRVGMVTVALMLVIASSLGGAQQEFERENLADVREVNVVGEELADGP